MTTSYPLIPIGHIRTAFPEKFGIPRQSGLVDAEGIVEMLPGFDKAELFEGIEAFSHIWLSFVFHESLSQGWRPRVRPPRLGGNQKKGVFATRSPFRPNHLGLSVVRLRSVETGVQGVRLHIGGADLLDGTPIVDIKPYLPYADAIEAATGGFAAERPLPVLQVAFSSVARKQLMGISGGEQLKSLIEQVISLDPRPAYRQQSDSGRVYGMRLKNYNLRWQVTEQTATIVDIQQDQ